MNKWLSASTCVAAVLSLASVSGQARTDRLTVDGCFVRGSAYPQVRNLAGYVLSDITVASTAPRIASSTNGASYGTYSGGNATASPSVSGQDNAGTIHEAVGTTGSTIDNIGVANPSTDKAGSQPGAAGTAAVPRGGPSAAADTTGPRSDVSAYSLVGVANPSAYIGKRVEITGTVMRASSAQNANRLAGLRVASVKVIPGSCQ